MGLEARKVPKLVITLATMGSSVAWPFSLYRGTHTVIRVIIYRVIIEGYYKRRVIRVII